MLDSLLFTVRQAISIYSFLCLIRILMSWVPSITYSPVGQFLASLCDPYLNWFKRFKFTQIGMVDFSPVLALGTLSIVSEFFSTFIRTGQVSLWGLFISFILMVWSFVGFVLNLLMIFLIIRLLYDIFSSSNTSQFWYTLDRFLNPVISKTTGMFSSKPMRYRTRLILTIVIVLAVRIALGMLVGSLAVSFYAVRIV
ncbi:MAG: YggT family protein [Treponema sp.]